MTTIRERSYKLIISAYRKPPTVAGIFLQIYKIVILYDAKEAWAVCVDFKVWVDQKQDKKLLHLHRLQEYST